MLPLFAKNLVFLREKKGENQSETASALNLSRSTYANYETGANLPKVDIAVKIIGHFGVTFEDLMQTDIQDVYLSEKKSDTKNKLVSIPPSIPSCIPMPADQPVVSAPSQVPTGGGAQSGADVLAALLEEVRKLRQDVDLLKKDLATPGAAVAGA